MTSGNRPRLPWLALVLIAVAAAGGLWAGARFSGDAPQPRSASLSVGQLYDVPRTLPAFSLAGAGGMPLTVDHLRRRWTLVFLGFTHCPDVCPTTLAQLAVAEKQWQDLPEPRRPRILFVSVDPERDTADAAQQYAHHFSPHILAATGERSALERFTQSLSLVFAKIPLGPSSYTIDHSSAIVLLDPEGRVAGAIRPPFDPRILGEEVRNLAAVDR